MKTVQYQRVGGLNYLVLDTACEIKNRTVKVCSRNVKIRFRWYKLEIFVMLFR